MYNTESGEHMRFPVGNIVLLPCNSNMFVALVPAYLRYKMEISKSGVQVRILRQDDPTACRI